MENDAVPDFDFAYLRWCLRSTFWGGRNVVPQRIAMASRDWKCILRRYARDGYKRVVSGLAKGTIGPGWAISLLSGHHWLVDRKATQWRNDRFQLGHTSLPLRVRSSHTRGWNTSYHQLEGHIQRRLRRKVVLLELCRFSFCSRRRSHDCAWTVRHTARGEASLAHVRFVFCRYRVFLSGPATGVSKSVARINRVVYSRVSATNSNDLLVGPI